MKFEELICLKLFSNKRFLKLIFRPFIFLLFMDGIT